MKKIFWIGASLLLLAPISLPAQRLTKKQRSVARMIGADISFLPQLESRGLKFYDQGVEKDAIAILKDRGFNYIRLRIFNNPAADSGYSPGKGFCDLAHTLVMAKRVKEAGMKLLLDFHYSDTWADPGKQFKPAAWKQLNFEALQQAIYRFTRMVLDSLKKQGTLPDMVQVGNEINHGLLWPDGQFQHPDTLAAFLRAGLSAVRETDRHILTMLHIACGGQNAESRAFLNSMLARGVRFNIIGESYYPRWHGSIADLKHNLTDLATRYRQPIIVVEYSELKKEVNDIAFGLPNGQGLGTCIWEPLSWGETLFNKDGHSNNLINIYPQLVQLYLH